MQHKERRLAMANKFKALLRARTWTLVSRTPTTNMLPNNGIMMALFSVIRLAWWPMPFIRSRALTMVKSLVLLLIILLFALSWLFLCSLVGPHVVCGAGAGSWAERSATGEPSDDGQPIVPRNILGGSGDH
ncbi:Protein of unknown function D [Prunus dulcis]|uniref:Uncharacterized protein n=1 Tax=Prunus dulcis TaxID=3755 RepID=A0A4Y1RJT9_PRUDU|nr:Protein of unknown function D [Prunus dulcis]